MRMLSYSILLLMTCVSSACSGTGKRCLSFPQTNGSYCLQPTTSVAPFSVQQKVEIQYKNRHEIMIADLEVNPQGLQFVTLTPLGQKVLQINDDNTTISQQSMVKSAINSAFLVGLLQLALWPSDAISSGLKPPLTMTETGQARMIRSEDATVVSIQYQDKSVPYQQLSIRLPQLSLSLDISQLDESTEADAQ